MTKESGQARERALATLLGPGHPWRPSDTIVNEAQVPELNWQQFGQAFLVDSSGRPPHELALPHSVLTKIRNGRRGAVPFPRLVIYVAEADDPETARRVFIALTTSGK